MSERREGCGTCRFMHDTEIAGLFGGDGQCRRFPPAPARDAIGVHEGIGIWPIVRCGSWCGEWQGTDPMIGQLVVDTAGEGG